jgi:GNAT superfamily N-acetyltransferase
MSARAETASATAREPILRIATQDDLTSLISLYAQLNPGDAQPSQDRLSAVLHDIVASRHFELVLAELEGRVVGTCYLNVIPNLSRGASPYAVVENVVVARAWRRRGVGRALLAFALARAWARGCYKAMLQTGSKSEGTFAFYRSCGFSPTEKTAFVARPPLPSA